MTNVWSVPGPSVEPVIDLIRWRVVENRGTWHLSGYSLTTLEGRLSSVVVTFDLVDIQFETDELYGLVRTASGRAYRLIGMPGYNDDAQYLLECYASAGSVFEDVTFQALRDWGVEP